MAEYKKHPVRGYVHQLDDGEIDRIRRFVKDLITQKGPDNDGVDRDEFRHKLVGYMAESAVCQHYGERFEYAITPGTGDGGIDFWSGEIPVAVQAVESSHKRLIVERKKVECSRPACEFVSCVVNPSQGRVHIRGFMGLEELKDRTPRRLVPGGPENYIVENDELYDVRPPKWGFNPIGEVTVGEVMGDPVYFEGPESYPEPMMLTRDDRLKFYRQGEGWRDCIPTDFEVGESEIWNNIKRERERQRLARDSREE